jgi:hypothetical protein
MGNRGTPNGIDKETLEAEWFLCRQLPIGGHSNVFAHFQSAICPFETSQAWWIFASEMIFCYRTSGSKRSSMEEEK